MISKINVGPIKFVTILKHRWERDLSYYEKDKWDCIKLGPWFRYHKGQEKSVIIGLHLLVLKFWVACIWSNKK